MPHSGAEPGQRVVGNQRETDFRRAAQIEHFRALTTGTRLAQIDLINIAGGGAQQLKDGLETGEKIFICHKKSIYFLLIGEKNGNIQGLDFFWRIVAARGALYIAGKVPSRMRGKAPGKPDRRTCPDRICAFRSSRKPRGA